MRNIAVLPVAELPWCGGARAWFAAVGAALLVTVAPAAFGQIAPMPRDQVMRERFESLENIRREPAELVVKARRQCASGQDPRATARSRALGAETSADSSDHCAAVLARVASDGGLIELYRDMVMSLNGSAAGVESLPAAIGAAVMKPGVNQVPIGNQRAAVISSALALDAGFSVAYQQGQKMTPAMPDLSSLKAIAERCLGLAEQDLGLCYSTGYVYGARAVNGQALAERPQP
ncbi:MAG: hypothetical protein JSR59_04050 [Proteobacteria bacterium]|nr:hypothetical protein [Pseudomonadota bacterium]